MSFCMLKQERIKQVTALEPRKLKPFFFKYLKQHDLHQKQVDSFTFLENKTKSQITDRNDLIRKPLDSVVIR